ncbi:MAG TPA: hypothetical protein VJ824_15995 [Bacillota bacterium]|nr:hypothetical protein [Bacillota bacterium]
MLKNQDSQIKKSLGLKEILVFGLAFVAGYVASIAVTVFTRGL